MQIIEAKKKTHEGSRIRSASKTRIFVWPQNETVLENFANRRTRPHDAWKPFAVKAAAMFGVNADSISWSQKAGCTCGCSPGFIVKGPHRPGFDIHLTVGLQ